MQIQRKPVVFACRGQELVGILDLPVRPAKQGVLIVTGGPQYRVGSHRQFVHLARQIAAAGYPVMRFDYRGMGDSGGNLQDFRACLPDIRAAIDTFVAQGDVTDVALWGLCDAASAGLIYAPDDARVNGLVLVNPWVRTDEGRARAYVRHYYLKRLFSRAFWTKLTAGEVSVWRSVRELAVNMQAAISRSRREAHGDMPVDDGLVRNFRQRMQRGLERFDGKVLLILCEEDLTAAEFSDYARRTSPWGALLEKVERRDLAGADHTFSRERWRDQVGRWTTEWLASC